MSEDDAIPQASYTVRGKERIKLWKHDLSDLAKDTGQHFPSQDCSWDLLATVIDAIFFGYSSCVDSTFGACKCACRLDAASVSRQVRGAAGTWLHVSLG